MKLAVEIFICEKKTLYICISYFYVPSIEQFLKKQLREENIHVGL